MYRYSIMLVGLLHVRCNMSRAIAHAAMAVGACGKRAGSRHAGPPQKRRRLRGAGSRADIVDERYRHAGLAWLTDAEREQQIRAHKRAHEQAGSSGCKKQAHGLQSPSLLCRQGDG